MEMVEQLVVRLADENAESSAVVQELAVERARMGRELHAGVGQPLSGIKMNLEILESFTDGLPVPALEAFARLQKLVDEALGQTRALAHRLCPPAWQLLPIATALRQLIDSSGIASRMRTSVDVDPGLIEPSHAARIAIYRCAQECLSNTTRHSDATCFELSLRMRAVPPNVNESDANHCDVNQSDVAGHCLELAVRDNGHGILREGSGIGLEAIREHAGSLGGSATVTSNPQGTTIVVSLPADAI